MHRDPLWGEPQKRLTLMDYDRGPCGYLECQIAKLMQRSFYPCIPGPTPALGSNSYMYGYISLAHEREASFSFSPAIDTSTYYATLADCVAVVAEKFQVAIEPTENNSTFRFCGPLGGDYEPPGFVDDQIGLALWFERSLPKVWKAHRDAQKRKLVNQKTSAEQKQLYRRMLYERAQL